MQWPCETGTPCDLARKNTGELRLSSTGGTRSGGVDDVIARAIFQGWDLTRSSEMRVAVHALLALALAGFAGRAVAARACDAAVHYSYNEPVEIEGVIKSGTGHHEAQGDFFYTYLELDQPVCVDAPKREATTISATPAPRSRSAASRSGARRASAICRRTGRASW